MLVVQLFCIIHFLAHDLILTKLAGCTSATDGRLAFEAKGHYITASDSWSLAAKQLFRSFETKDNFKTVTANNLLRLCKCRSHLGEREHFEMLGDYGHTNTDVIWATYFGTVSDYRLLKLLVPFFPCTATCGHANAEHICGQRSLWNG